MATVTLSFNNYIFQCPI